MALGGHSQVLTTNASSRGDLGVLGQGSRFLQEWKIKGRTLRTETAVFLNLNLWSEISAIFFHFCCIVWFRSKCQIQPTFQERGIKLHLLTGGIPDGLWLDIGKDWGQDEKGVTENEMIGWHHCLNGREFKLPQGDSEGQGSLVCCNSWGPKCWTWFSNWTTPTIGFKPSPAGTWEVTSRQNLLTSVLNFVD